MRNTHNNVSSTKLPTQIDYKRLETIVRYTLNRASGEETTAANIFEQDMLLLGSERYIIDFVIDSLLKGSELDLNKEDLEYILSIEYRLSMEKGLQSL